MDSKLLGPGTIFKAKHAGRNKLSIKKSIRYLPFTIYLFTFT
ncbi:hypothetical protein IMCC1989_1906 [gamma proteobacterium IMCC1989]|nr:hypothetical protein IMCC1989_1906 [gamma proteobacterium IMCC1989]